MAAAGGSVGCTCVLERLVRSDGHSRAPPHLGDLTGRVSCSVLNGVWSYVVLDSHPGYEASRRHPRLFDAGDVARPPEI